MSASEINELPAEANKCEILGFVNAILGQLAQANLSKSVPKYRLSLGAAPRNTRGFGA
jgi:hypothetical protein